MRVSARDDRVKEVIKSPPGTSIKALQPKIATKIKARVEVLIACTTLTQVATLNPQWRVHQHKGADKPWSIDVEGNTRLLFYYDKEEHIITGMYYYDPH